MRVSRPAIVAFVSALLLLSTTGRSQQDQQQQRPIFRTATDVVRVDVYPRRNGKVVEGLKKEDFKVTENGVAQTVDTFEYMSTGGYDAEPLDPRSPHEARKMAADPHNRVFVFYLDIYQIDMQGSARAREPFLNFIRFGLAPRDIVAVMTPRQSPEYLEFTRSTEALGAMMTVTRPWGLMGSPELEKDEYELEACRPGRNGPPGPLVQRKRTRKVMSDLRELITRLGLLREERKNLVVIGERWQTGGVRRDPASASTGDTLGIDSVLRAQIGPPIQRGRGSFEPPPSAGNKCSMLEAMVSGAVTEASIRDLVTLARRANVSMYFLPPNPQLLWNSGIARWIAEDTDGLSIVGNDIGLNLMKIAEHQAGYYMLGYKSTAGEVGNREREVRVRTSAKGVDLDIRRLYDPVPPDAAARMANPPPPIERTDVQKAMDALAQLDYLERNFVQAARRTSAIDLTVEVSSRTAQSTAWKNGARVAVTLLDDEGAEVTKAAGAIVPGERSLRLTIPENDGRKATRANVAVTSAAETIREVTDIATSPFEAPWVFRAAALPRAPYFPAAMMAFDRTERIRVEWPTSSAMTDVAVRLLNAAGEPRAADLVVTTAGDDTEPRRLRADLRPASLAMGDYALEATGEIDGVRVKQVLAIRIVR